MSQVKNPVPAPVSVGLPARERESREFREPLEAEPLDSPARRRFLTLMGASLALAGCRWKEDKLMPLPHRPEGWVPGEARNFATTMELGGVGIGLLAASYEGRPIKIEGNPAHATSRGAASLFQQAAILEMYDPDRSTTLVSNAGGRKASSWDEFRRFANAIFGALRGTRGVGLRVLSEASSSPTLGELKKKLTDDFAQVKWVEWEPISRDNERAGSVLAFGKPMRTHLVLEQADVVVCLDADPVSPVNPAGLANARAFTERRVPEKGQMSRVYTIESTPGLTGIAGDHRLALRSELIKAVAAHLDAELSAKARPLSELGASQQKPNAQFLSDPKVAKFLDAMVKDLLANIGKSVVVAGAHQPAEVHALCHRINAVLGNAGRTVTYSDELDADRPTHLDAMKALITEMNAGQVDTLLILGGNPVYDAPADLGFEAALAKVKNSVHLALYEDETSKKCTWHLPRAHWLEAWGDARGWDGTISIAQPLIVALNPEVKSPIELLAMLLGDEVESGRDLVHRTHKASLADDKRWRRAVHDGQIENTAKERSTPPLKPLAAIHLSERELGPINLGNGQLEILFQADRKIYDGRFANNAWLQELADPIGKVAWDSTAFFSPNTAKALGITEGHLVRLAVDGGQIEMNAVIVPGQADGSVRVPLGYGRTSSGQVGGHNERDGAEIAGVDAYRLRTTNNFHFGGGLQASPTGTAVLTAAQQDLHTIDEIGQVGLQQRIGEILREATLARFQKEPDFAKHMVHSPPLLNPWRDPVIYNGHKWGMSIDLNRCIGCNSCVIACQSENNIPIVGKANVERGREMHWLRIDRYYRGNENDASLAFQPVPCMQCENAPCESVCPVGATVHSHEGLNDMTYNRCIGTRYCSNNCPYKVRRFNFFNYHLDKQGITPFNTVTEPKKKLLQMAMNPEVTLRARGVMEKCTYCVQRIMKVRIKAKNAKRPIVDGEIKTACQQTCPTDAIVFGDLNDGQSRVAQLQALPRTYALLAELNTRPRTQYMARIRNPNLELAPEAPSEAAHGGEPEEKHG